MTLEEALVKIAEQESIIKDKDVEINSHKVQADKFKEDIKAKNTDLEKLREYNMNLFLKLTSQKEDNSSGGEGENKKDIEEEITPEENLNNLIDEMVKEMK